MGCELCWAEGNGANESEARGEARHPPQPRFAGTTGQQPLPEALRIAITSTSAFAHEYGAQMTRRS